MGKLSEVLQGQGTLVGKRDHAVRAKYRFLLQVSEFASHLSKRYFVSAKATTGDLSLELFKSYTLKLDDCGTDAEVPVRPHSVTIPGTTWDLYVDAPGYLEQRYPDGKWIKPTPQSEMGTVRRWLSQIWRGRDRPKILGEIKEGSVGPIFPEELSDLYAAASESFQFLMASGRCSSCKVEIVRELALIYRLAENIELLVGFECGVSGSWVPFIYFSHGRIPHDFKDVVRELQLDKIGVSRRDYRNYLGACAQRLEQNFDAIMLHVGASKTSTPGKNMGRTKDDFFTLLGQGETGPASVGDVCETNASFQK